MRGGLSDDDTSFSSPVRNLTKWSLLPFVLFLFLSPIFANWARTFRGACFPFYQRKIKEEKTLSDRFSVTVSILRQGKTGTRYFAKSSEIVFVCISNRRALPPFYGYFPVLFFFGGIHVHAHMFKDRHAPFFQDRTTLITPRVDSNQTKKDLSQFALIRRRRKICFTNRRSRRVKTVLRNSIYEYNFRGRSHANPPKWCICQFQDVCPNKWKLLELASGYRASPLFLERILRGNNSTSENRLGKCKELHSSVPRVIYQPESTLSSLSTFDTLDRGFSSRRLLAPIKLHVHGFLVCHGLE